MTVETDNESRRAARRTAGRDEKREKREKPVGRKTGGAAEPDNKPTTDEGSPATPLLALLGCACLIMAVGCVYLWHQSVHDRAVERARADASNAAQSEAKDLLSYNFRTLDYDLSKAKSEMTSGMAKSFSDYWQIFRPSVAKSQTQALTQIQVTAVTDATPTRVEVVLFVKMISVNAAHKEPQVDTSWPRLQMQKVGKKWLIDGPRMTTPPPASSNPTPAPSTSKKPAAKTTPKSKSSRKP